MIEIKRTNSDDLDFLSLVKLLDQDLAISDGDEHAFYAQYNKVDKIKYCLIAYQDSSPIGCGALRHFADDKIEVKRMYVLPEARNKGAATIILCALEAWAAELGYPSCILETGKKQPYAIALYHKNGYQVIPNYGPYIGVENSICFMKDISLT